jgi:hypothetical protein
MTELRRDSGHRGIQSRSKLVAQLDQLLAESLLGFAVDVLWRNYDRKWLAP